jgi:hypothetical protein
MVEEIFTAERAGGIELGERWGASTLELGRSETAFLEGI